MHGSKFVDSGGGFLIEQSIDANKPNEAAIDGAQVEIDSIQIPIVYETCLECDQNFVESYLMKNFEHSVCDGCRDNDDKHSLIAKTEAKTEYLLKDCDFDKREPPLKFISRKNPHNVRWGEMKLYLHLQVEQRALEVWGSEEALLQERECRDVKRDKSKLKKYNKNLKKLRMEVRSSLFDNRSTAEFHTHSYGVETYNEDDDTYSRECDCGFVETFEKM